MTLSAWVQVVYVVMFSKLYSGVYHTARIGRQSLVAADNSSWWQPKKKIPYNNIGEWFKQLAVIASCVCKRGKNMVSTIPANRTRVHNVVNRSFLGQVSRHGCIHVVATFLTNVTNVPSCHILQDVVWRLWQCSLHTLQIYLHVTSMSHCLQYTLSVHIVATTEQSQETGVNGQELWLLFVCPNIT